MTCAGCPHKPHRDRCPAKGSSKCVTLLDSQTGLPAGIACHATRAPCPCPRGWCHACGALIAGASPFPLGVADEIDIDIGSAGDPAGLVAVIALADGTLAARRLGAGEPLPQGMHGDGPARWWRGREHACQEGASNAR